MFDIAGQTHVGLVRKENQDGFLAVRLAAGDRQYACLVVADGMGGHLDGRLASETAIKTVKSHLNAPTIDPDHPERWLEEVVQEAHREVGKLGNGQIVGTTLTIAIVGEKSCTVGHVGDSRAYRWHKGRLEPETVDHTWEEYAKKHGIENAHGDHLRQAIGVGPSVEVETSTFPVESGDALLVCSDGLHKFVAHSLVTAAIGKAKDARDACDRLVAQSLRSGGRDNVGVALAYIGHRERRGCRFF